MREKNSENRSIRLAGYAGACMIAAGFLFLRFEQSIHAQGTVYARAESHLYAPADATLAALPVSLGQDVLSGDVIAVLENPELKSQALQLEKDITEMAAQLAQNEIALLATNVLPELEQDKLRLDRNRLEKKIALATEELQLASDQLAALRVTSPADGRVVALEYRYAGMSVPHGSLLAKVAVMDGHYRVRALAPEKNVDLIKIGTLAYMKSGVFNSMLEGYVKGAVSRIAPEAKRDTPETEVERRYEIYIDVEATPYPLSLGSTMEVELRLGKRPLWGMLFDTQHRRTDT